MRISKKICAAIVASCAVLAFSGCTGSPEVKEEPKKSAADTEEEWKKAATTSYGKYPELVTYTLAQMNGASNSNLPSGDTYEDNEYTRYLKKMLNIQNENVYMEREDRYNEGINVLVQDRNIPDIMVVNDRETLNLLVENDMIEDLSQVYESCASDRIKEMYDSYGPALLASGTYDGKLMALPETVIDHGPCFLWLRRDWINQLGLEEPENLDDAFFYINKQDANAKYVKQVVKSANQLNEKEALKVDMVADVSGSMDGSPLNEAKQVMSDFVGSVQFDAGDLVELTSFSTGVCLEQEFSDDAATLTNDINNLVTGDMTSLYDALYTAVERVAAQNGARCVIAFTDGNDNYSNCTKEDVVNVANRYHVPVFIIGIGSIDYADVNDIATQTGGMYYNVSDVTSMDKIYEEIYQMEKQLYLVEFEDNTGATVGDTANIQAGYHSIDYGGECEYTYTPNVLMSAQSRDIYTDGPQAAVEGYLKNFDSAMNKSDFSLISGYLKNGSPIYTEQEKYVLRDITERLDSYELTDVSYADANNCVISTRETYYVQVKGKPLQLMTQECKYNVENQGDKWQLTSFVDIKVVSRIKQ